MDKDLANIAMNKELLKEAYKVEKKRVNKELRRKHKANFIALDILVILALLSNITAHSITNVLVTKETDPVFYELNPVTAIVNNYETAPEMFTWTDIRPMLYSFLVWTLLVTVYFYQRYTITSIRLLNTLTLMLLLMAATLTWDAIHDATLLIGTLL